MTTKLEKLKVERDAAFHAYANTPLEDRDITYGADTARDLYNDLATAYNEEMEFRLKFKSYADYRDHQQHEETVRMTKEFITAAEATVMSSKSLELTDHLLEHNVFGLIREAAKNGNYFINIPRSGSDLKEAREKLGWYASPEWQESFNVLRKLGYTAGIYNGSLSFITISWVQGEEFEE